MSKNGFIAVVGRRIKKSRLDLGISQEELASISFVDRTYLCQIELGTANPTLRVLCRLSRALGTSVSEITRP